MAQHYRGRAVAILFLGEIAPQRGTQADHFQEAGGNHGPDDMLWLSGTREIDRAATSVGLDLIGQAGVCTPVVEIWSGRSWNRGLVRPELADVHQPVRVLVRKI